MIRQKFFTFLNLAGLATGSAAFLLIFLYVTDELSYDKFHANSENIYRVNMTNIWIESQAMFGSTTPAVAAAIKSEVPEVQQAVRLHIPYLEQLVSIEDPNGLEQSYRETGIIASDDGFFDLFSFEMVEGEPKTALREPNSVVITKSQADKYFGEQSALGQQLVLGVSPNHRVFQVTGVIEDVPEQSHFDFKLLLSMNSFQHIINRSNSWIWTGFVTYVSINPDARISEVNAKLAVLPAKFVGEEKAREKDWTLALHNIEDIHLYSTNIPNRLGTVGNIQNVMIFSAVALVILLLSCINFMNLSTAKFTARAKEIGLQKVLGSSKTNIRLQFLVESLTYSLFAVIIGFGLAEVTRPFFNQLAAKNLSLNLFQKPELILVMIGLVFITGITSGFYPAWFMTRFKVIDAVRGKISASGSKAGFRNILVLFQFTISVALISASILVKDQLQFLQNRDLGFDQERVLVIPHLEWMKDGGKLFSERVVNEGLFEKAAISNSVPPRSWDQDNFTPLNSTKTTELPVTIISAEAEFVDVLGLPIIAGRSFFESGDGDANKVLINEECAIQMEWMKPGEDPDKVLGSRMVYYDEEPFEIVGVLKDFNFMSLHLPVEPMAIFHPDAPVFKGISRFLTVRVSENSIENYENVIARTKDIWTDLNPNLPFDYQFMDQSFDNAFASQRRFGNVLDAFSALAIFIAVLGLTGLIAFTIEQKTKEFGIRKVLGASIQNLISIVTFDFVKLLVIGMVAGSAMTWYFGSSWLQNFTYQSTISPRIFVIAVLMILFLIMAIAWFIVLQTARKNPATVLRDD